MPLTAPECNDMKMEAEALEQETGTDCNIASPCDIKKSAEKILHSKLLKASLQHVRKKLKLDCFPNVKSSSNIDVNQKVVHCLPFDCTEIDGATIGLEHVNEYDSSFVSGNTCEFTNLNENCCDRQLPDSYKCVQSSRQVIIIEPKESFNTDVDLKLHELCQSNATDVCLQNAPTYLGSRCDMPMHEQYSSSCTGSMTCTVGSEAIATQASLCSVNDMQRTSDNELSFTFNDGLSDDDLFALTQTADDMDRLCDEKVFIISTDSTMKCSSAMQSDCFVSVDSNACSSTITNVQHTQALNKLSGILEVNSNERQASNTSVYSKLYDADGLTYNKPIKAKVASPKTLKHVVVRKSITPKKMHIADNKQASIMAFFKCSATNNNHSSSANNISGNIADNNKAPPSVVSSGSIAGGSKASWTFIPKFKQSFNFKGGKQSIPDYKMVQGTRFTVDAFSYGEITGCTAYFLSHFHSDHYQGLSKRFTWPVYCSKVTANLVRKKLYVLPEYINALPVGSSTVIDDVEVTLIEANHCPGSVMMVFKVRNGPTILHTGDFRASVDMEIHPMLQDCHIDFLYLDTTYLNPTYTFPAQLEVISFAVKKALEFMITHPCGLVLVGTYTIGKERIFTAIAEALDSRIFVQRDKKAILDCLDDLSLSSRLTRNDNEARVHVVSMSALSYQSLAAYVAEHPNCDGLLAFEPTGWTQAKGQPLPLLKPKIKSGLITLYGVPYSEHSSYAELKRFVQFMRPSTVIPTVPVRGDKASLQQAATINNWLQEVRNVSVNTVSHSPRKTVRQLTLSPSSWNKAINR